MKLGCLVLLDLPNLSSIVPRAEGDGHRLGTKGAMGHSREPTDVKKGG
jgi:hypothetical protein